ncbi:MAG: TolB family protein [Ignavibacteria bacterium]
MPQINFFCMFLIFIFFQTECTYSQEENAGLFENDSDIGHVLIPGSAKYNPEDKSYSVTGSGENIWFTNDAFHFLYKKMSGDISFSADLSWIGEGVHPHRKACFFIRESLEPNSPYVDIALHGDGLTSLQFREEKGGLTSQVESAVKAPKRVLIEKRGDQFYMFTAGENEDLHYAGGSYWIKLKEPFYVGFGVCSHDSTVIETAVFSNVELKRLEDKGKGESMIESTLETVAIDSRNRKVIYNAKKHFEAPNWSRNGNYFLFNQEGKIYKLPVNGGEPTLINTDFAVKCNNDHGISPDGTKLVISDQTKDDKSRIYTLPIEGGTPKLITENTPSYWHGWSPDGKTLAYCAERNGNYDIFTIPAEGGEEKRLTTAEGLDDGPDYSPDGQYIYFNSDRTGLMQIWRMKTDGSGQEQVTNDEYNNWFAHPSPDGKWIVFLTYEKDVEGHPANKDVMLRIMPAEGGEIQVLTRLFGGQGTINVPSWSPDSKNAAFVSYRLVK